MARGTPWWILLLSLSAAPACGGLSTEEAEQRCDQLAEANPVCVTDAALSACVSCYEDCGDDCTPSGTCPQTFSCDE